MKKLLVILSNNMNRGGAETFMMKIYRNLDKMKYQMDFCVSSSEPGIYDAEIAEMGGKVIPCTSKSLNYYKHRKELIHIIKSENYHSVLRIGTNALSALELWIAKKHGVKIRAYRSSNAGDEIGVLGRLIHQLFSPIIFSVVNVKIAPSKLAAEYTFRRLREVIILHNALDYNEYSFDINKREYTRNKLGVDDRFVVGHIGRFMKQKNHMFLLDVFIEIKKKEPNAILILVGNGILEKEIREKLLEYNINESVIFTGTRSDISSLLMAFDVLVFPSLYEGMPNVVIEAQATGLSCILADSITKESDITGLVKFISLQEKPSAWASLALKSPRCFDIFEISQRFLNYGYDIESVTNQFVELLFKDN